MGFRTPNHELAGYPLPNPSTTSHTAKTVN